LIHFAPRPQPFDSINHSDFIAHSTSLTTSQLTLGQASSISEIENGRTPERPSAPGRLCCHAQFDGANTPLELAAWQQQRPRD